MRTIFSILSSCLVFATGSFAAQLRCETRPTDTYPAPTFTFQAQVEDTYLKGHDLQKFENVKVSAQEKKEIENLELDKSYKPRKSKNQNRVRFLFDLPATSDNFDGIIHGVIFPKDLTKEETLESNADGMTFRALVTSSTDSYHDGIISYYRLYCQALLPILE